MSKFTDAWRKVIEDTGYNIELNASAMGAKPGDVEKWFNDEEPPNAHLLRLFVASLEPYKDQSRFQEFYNVLNDRSWKVSPLGYTMWPSIGHWMLHEYRWSLETALATVPFDVEKEILTNAIATCVRRRVSEH